MTKDFSFSPPGYIRWSDEEVKILKELVKKRVSVKDIQKVLKDRTRNAIQNKIRDLGLTIASTRGGIIDYAILGAIRKVVKG